MYFAFITKHLTSNSVAVSKNGFKIIPLGSKQCHMSWKLTWKYYVVKHETTNWSPQNLVKPPSSEKSTNPPPPSDTRLPFDQS